MLTSAHKFLFVVIAKIEYLHSSQVFKTLGCFFIPKRRSDYEFPTQNPLAKIKIFRKEPTINKSTGERNNSQGINKVKKEYSKADRREAANKKIRRTRVIENGPRSSYRTS